MKLWPSSSITYHNISQGSPEKKVQTNHIKNYFCQCYFYFPIPEKVQTRNPTPSYPPPTEETRRHLRHLFQVRILTHFGKAPKVPGKTANLFFRRNTS